MKRKSKKEKAPKEVTIEELLPETRYTKMNKIKYYILDKQKPIEKSIFKIKAVCFKCKAVFYYETNQVLVFHEALSTEIHYCAACEGKQKVIRFYKVINGKKVTVKKIPIRSGD